MTFILFCCYPIVPFSNNINPKTSATTFESSPLILRLSAPQISTKQSGLFIAWIDNKIVCKPKSNRRWTFCHVSWKLQVAENVWLSYIIPIQVYTAHLVTVGRNGAQINNVISSWWNYLEINLQWNPGKTDSSNKKLDNSKCFSCSLQWLWTLNAPHNTHIQPCDPSDLY